MTLNDAGTGANPATTIDVGAELLDAKFESPPYWATIEFGPAARDELATLVFPLLSRAPGPSETPFAKNVTDPDGVPDAVAGPATVAESIVACPATAGLEIWPRMVVVAAVPAEIAVTKIASRGPLPFR